MEERVAVIPTNALGKALKFCDELTKIVVMDEQGRKLPFDSMSFRIHENTILVEVKLKGFGVPA